jgi:hypothetical protein
MLWTIIVVLIVLWALGLIGNIGGGLLSKGVNYEESL